MECISGSERHSCQPRLLYPGKLSYGEIYNRETKTLLDKRRLMEFMTTKPALQRILREKLQSVWNDAH